MNLYVKKHANVILTIIGIVGMISTVVLAVRETSKCDELIEKAEAKLREETKDENAVLDRKETIKCFAKTYWPSIAMGIVTVSAFVGSVYVSEKRQGTMATALALSEGALHRFQDITLETVGKDTMDKIHAKVADTQLKGNPLKDTAKVEVSTIGPATTRCYDPYTGRYFDSDIETIRRAVNDLNEDLLTGDFISLNDFYYKIGLAEVERGDEFGWYAGDVTELIEVKFSARLAENGTPCIVIGYDVCPVYMDKRYD